MAATLQQIAQYLDALEWHYEIDQPSSQIITGVRGENVDRLLVVIGLDEEGEFFEIYAPRVLEGIQNHPHKAAILQTMLCISWETRMLQWEYDPADGEIRAIIEFPLEDASLTERQFRRCLDGLIRIVDEMAMPRLQHVMATGEDPGDIAEGERLLLTLQESNPGLLLALERAMEARKRRGIVPFKGDEDLPFAPF